jgi:hypothetical protein
MEENAGRRHLDRKVIPNHLLVARLIPGAEATWDQIQRFALTFDSGRCVEDCAEVANSRRHSTLTDLRACLLFEQRRWRHFGIAPDPDAMQYIRSVLKQIRDRAALANMLLE